MAGGGWIRVGCLGCLGLVALSVVVVVVMVVVAFTGDAAEPRLESAEWTRAVGLPRPPEAGEPPPAGRLILDLSVGELVVVPGPAGGPIRVEADYDASRYDLEKRFEGGGELGWTYRVHLEGRGFWLRRLRGGHGALNRVRVVVPEDTPLDLEARVGVGATDLELGGLDLGEVLVETGIGEHRLRFSSPAARPLRRLRVAADVGEVHVSGLGHASPARAAVRHGIGELWVDLSGDWSAASEIEASLGLGECRVLLPGDLPVALQASGPSLGARRGPPAGAHDRSGAAEVSLAIRQRVGEMTLTRSVAPRSRTAGSPETGSRPAVSRAADGM